MKVTLHPAAAQEIQEAAAFYEREGSPIVTKTHFLMFGSYRINDPRIGRLPRLELTFKNGIVFFYACSIKFGADEIKILVVKHDSKRPGFGGKRS